MHLYFDTVSVVHVYTYCMQIVSSMVGVHVVGVGGGGATCFLNKM